MIFVDALREHVRRGWLRQPITGFWCHLATDGPLRELHDFAASIGVPPRAFHAHPAHPHYDLDAERRAAAVAAGAIEVGSKELVKRCFRRTRSV